MFQIIILLMLCFISLIGGVFFKRKKKGTPFDYIYAKLRNIYNVISSYPKLWWIDGKIYFLALFRKKERTFIKDYKLYENVPLTAETKEFLVNELDYFKSKYFFVQISRHRRRTEAKKKKRKFPYHKGLSTVENEFRNFYYFQEVEKERWKRDMHLDKEKIEEYTLLEQEELNQIAQQEKLQKQQEEERLKIEKEKQQLQFAFNVENTQRRIKKSSGEKFDETVILKEKS